MAVTRDAGPVDEAPLHRLLASLPGPVSRGFQRLRHPRMRPVRLPLGVMCVLGGLLGFLPVLGFWMLPVGALLAEDVPALKRPTMRALAAVHGWWDRQGRA